MKKPSLVRTIILAGSLLLQLSTFCFQSHAAAGDVDLSFDPGSGVNGTVKAIAVQSDGKIIIGGDFVGRPGITRLNADGSEEITFNHAIANNFVSSLALQPDGKVIVAVHFPQTYCDDSGCFDYTQLVVLRINADGSEGTNYYSFIESLYDDGHASIESLAVQTDGKLIVGGDFYISNGAYGITRLNSNGSLDNSFNAGLPGNYYYLNSVALQSDGKILVGGGFGNGTNNNIARLNSNGSLDNSFNSGAGANGAVRSVVVQSDGRLLISGDFTLVHGTNRNRIARLNSNGSLDSGFNPGTGANSAVRAIALQSDGKVLIGGSFTDFNGTTRAGIARLNPDGSLDNDFNPGARAGGLVRTIALQSDGKVLIGGDFLTINGSLRPYVVRLYGDSIIAPSLNIVPSNTSVILSWPVTALNFQLHENSNFALPNSWSPVAQTATTNGHQVSIAVPTAVGSKIFRLKSP